jgi:upstream activation factor subunit UAF30
MERFDKANADNTSSSDDAPLTNGHQKVKAEANGGATETRSPPTDDASDADVKPPKKKQRKVVDADAELAAKLQAQENSRARPTRNGANKKAPVVKKKRTTKKSASKIKATDDSDIEVGSDGQEKPVVRKGGFHKEYYLSEPLKDLVGGTTQASHPY